MKRTRSCILFLLLIPVLSVCSSQKQNIAKAEMDVRAIRMALIEYAMHDGRYPTTQQGLQALLTKPALSPEKAEWDGPYLDSDLLIDPWGNAYIYRSPGTSDPENHRYDLYSHGPDGKEGGGDDIDIWEVAKRLGIE